MAEINVDGIEIEKRVQSISDDDWPDFLVQVERLGGDTDGTVLAKRLYTVFQTLYPELTEDLLSPEANAATGEFTFGG